MTEYSMKCKNCGAACKYEYCQHCNERCSNELAITMKYPEEMDKTVDFYRLKLIDKFKNHNRVILSYLDKSENVYLVNRIVEETRHMGFLQEKRKKKMHKMPNPPHLELKFYKAPLSLIPAVRGLKKDRRWDD